MLFLDKLRLSLWTTAIIDALVIALVMFALLFIFLFRPLVYQITERKVALKALRTNEERYRSIFRNIQDVYYELTLDGIFLEISPSVKYLTSGQYHRKDLIGKSINVFCADQIQHEEFKSALMKSSSVTDYEFTFKNKDDSILPCSISARLYCDVKGSPVKITGSIHDISRRKKIEAELREKNEELLALNVQKDKLFSIISHDLRSPFNAFLGITGIMSDKENKYTIEDFRRLAGILNKSARNFYQLLENLLQWSQLKQNKLVLNTRILILSDITSHCIESLQDVASAKQITIINMIPGKITVLADEVMLKSVLMNLITNALKFTRRNGEIVLNTRTLKKNEIEISVKDTGIGMSEELVDKLFRNDIVLTRPGTEGEPSTGLGLIICKEFIEKNGGRLRVESQENKGTTFYFTLPKPE
ncbi:MAG TPA: PAS domain-containing sensor histidine kinase [Bacteroidales bacterium]|jgi:PAS domain S-box-containing protein|nr:PAS domain-containing sensor histidine kinase [Bacteroidales bacterium]